MKIIVYCTMTLALLCAVPTHIAAEIVFLKDGSIHKGTVLRETAAIVVLHQKNGKTITFPQKKVMRILYTKLQMGRVFVQLRDGRGLELYRVDEDETSFTFRRDLTKPVEMIVKRNDILFISEKNPSGLKGKAGKNTIKLAWYPPYNRVKYYNIYLSNNKKDKQKIVAKSRGKKIILRGLKSNTWHSIYVTAVDFDKYESKSSNRVKVLTKKFIIGPPADVGFSSTLTLKNKARILKISWKPVINRNGRITEYRIYRKNGKKYQRIGITKKRIFL